MARQRLVKYLIEQGANIEAEVKNGWTSLHLAAESGHAEVVKYLIDQGADRETKSNGGHKAIDIANDKGHQAIVYILSRVYYRANIFYS